MPSAWANVELVKTQFKVASLPTDHPIRALFDRLEDPTAAAEARFKLHHLASDARAVAGVPGATALLRALVKDVEHYDDYRYELRLAGAVARSPGQQLVGLGGKDSGPDVELTSQSGHRCGIACFRANPVTPHLQESGEINGDIVANLAVAVGSQPIAARSSIELAFNEFPILPGTREGAFEAFEELWQSGVARVTKGEVTVTRTRFDPAAAGPWEVRLTFLLPVPEREKQRLAQKIRDKVLREHKTWAGSYQGVPIFAIEETDFALGVEDKLLAATLESDAPHAFVGILKTWPYFVDHEHGGRCLVEQVHWAARPTLGTGVKLNLATFGLNSIELEKGHLMFELRPHSATEEWVLTPRLLGNDLPECIDIACTRPLGIVRRMARIPHEPGMQITESQIAPIVNEWFPTSPEKERA